MTRVSRRMGVLLTVALLLALPADAQWYTVLHAFDESDGIPARLVQATDGNFYGTTYSGPTSKGTVFRMTPAGMLTTLYSFAGSDGQNPIGGLVQGTDGSLYGTTQLGGASGKGTVFRITPSGMLTTLHSFTGDDGGNPCADLVQGRDGDFYGTTYSGGANNNGTVFKITLGGTLTTLYSFAAVAAVIGPFPQRPGLTQGIDGNFYGTTIGGGASGWGSVFRITPLGILTTLHSFTGLDGGGPDSPLVLRSDGNFYGTTLIGGTGDVSLPVISRAGTVFRITPVGTLTTLYSFAGTGVGPQTAGASLVQGSDGNFWGTTTATGANGCGTVFRMTPGGALTTLVELPGTWSDGCSPGGLVQASDGSFYGATPLGGAFGEGVVFRVTRDPELFLPVILDDVPGVAGSRYTTELTLSSKATTPIPVTLAYTASLGSGSGSIPVTLAAGETRILPNAVAFLRAQGLPIPAGAAVGTLHATFVGAEPSDDPFIGGRTYTARGGGTFGVFYPALPTTATTATLVGLQQNAAQRSNLALVNPGATPITLRVVLFGPLGDDLGPLPDETLPPYGWAQINAPLEGKASSGRAVVSGSSPFTAYAVLNDAVTSDGSFIPPLIPTRGGSGDRFVPIVLDAHGVGGSHYTTELTVANLTATRLPVELVYNASLGSGSGVAVLELGPGEQRILPDAIGFLRSQRLDIPADGSSVGGSIHALADQGSGKTDSVFAIGARIFTPAPGGGTFGTYISGLTWDEWATSVAYVNGLEQSTTQRSNLALVNCGDPSQLGDASDTITLNVSYFDGAGAALGTTSVSLAPGQWTQFNQPLAAFGATSGYARIEKTSGNTAFVAYGILNDAVTSDGSYIPMSF